MPFPLNCWYLAAWDNEVPEGGHLARVIAGKPVLLMRDEAGRMAALHDRCPHRMAPLSRGRFEDGVVACGYHGIAFDMHGKCVNNPHGPIVSSLCVTSFPVQLRHKGVWIWLGDPEKADQDQIADLSDMEAFPETAQSTGLLPVAANYQLCSDNIMDLTHGDYLHPDTVGGGAATRSKQTVREEENCIVVRWDLKGEIAPPLLAAALPDKDMPVDFHIEVRWWAPSVMWLQFGAQASDNPEIHMSNMAFHIFTPVDEYNTLYFFWLGRGQEQHNAELNKDYLDLTIRVFHTEDTPMLEAQQRAIGQVDIEEIRPVLIRTDEPSVRARRRVKGMVKRELENV